MSVWHGDLRKKKHTGGKKRSYRKKRKFEIGSFPIETTLAKEKKKIVKTRGGNLKIKLLSIDKVNLSNPKKK